VELGVQSVTEKVNQVRKDVDLELEATKKDMNSVLVNLEKKVDKKNSQTDIIVDGLASKLIHARTEFQSDVKLVDDKVEMLGQEVMVIKDEIKESTDVVLKRPWESVEQMQSQACRDKASLENKVESLDLQIVELKALFSARSNTSVPRTPSSARESDDADESVSERVPANDSCSRYQFAGGGFTSTELPLPVFDENLDINPKFHLDEFMKLKGIPQSCQLAVARKSVMGTQSRQWLEAISDKLDNYDDFRNAFISTWWSPSQQILLKCKLYQSRYDRRSGLTLSGHFLKYATMASHLEPAPPTIELIEALRQHYSIHVQRVMLGTQIHSIGDAIDLLKRIELMEDQVYSHRTPNNPQAQDANQNQRAGHPRHYQDRNRVHGQVRNVQRYRPRNQIPRYQFWRNHYDPRRGEVFDNEEPRDPRGRNMPEGTQRNDSPRCERVAHRSEN
jgi:hypothetical protein